MAKQPSVAVFDETMMREQLLAKLPKEIVHHVKVRIVFDFVTPHPITGEDVPIKPEAKLIAK